MFTLVISCLTNSNLLTFQVPVRCCVQYQTFLSPPDTSHNWQLFLLCISLFIPSGAISLLFSSSILGTYPPEEFIFHYHIFSPFNTVQVWLFIFVPDIRGKAFNLSMLMMLALGLLCMPFIMLRYVPSILNLLRIFIMKGFLNFIKCFILYLLRWLYDFHLSFF